MNLQASITGVTVLAASAVAAQACVPLEVTGKSVTSGDACTKTYADPALAFGIVSASPVSDLGNGVLRQYVSTGACNQGEQIVVYYDCKSARGVWLGSSRQDVAALQPKTSDGSFAPVMVDEGVAGGFVRMQEPRFAPDFNTDAILAAAKRLDWVDQSGGFGQSRIAVDGKTFDMSCGCRLHYPQMAGAQ